MRVVAVSTDDTSTLLGSGRGLILLENYRGQTFSVRLWSICGGCDGGVSTRSTPPHPPRQSGDGEETRRLLAISLL